MDLSQEETDTVVASEQADGMEASEGTTVQAESYDFRRPNRIPKEQEKTLTLIYESYASSVAIALSAFLRSEVSIHLHQVEQVSYHEYQSSLNNPTCVASFDMQPLSGYGVIEVNAALVFTIIDKMLGGEGSSPETMRNFTDIELAIARKLLNLLLTNLSESWGHILSIAFGLKEVQTNPSFIRSVSTREACVTSTFKMTIGEITEIFSLCIPYATLEPIAGKLRNDQANRFQAKQSDDVAAAHKRNFEGLEVEVDAILSKMEITMEDLLRLQVGDILDTGKRARDPIELRVAGVPKFMASPGLVGRHRGVAIQNEMAKE